jgi:hypothetical protein
MHESDFTGHQERTGTTRGNHAHARPTLCKGVQCISLTRAPQPTGLEPQKA